MSNTINDQFITATRKKLRFDSARGQLTVEDLWDLPLTKLDNLAIGLDKAVSEMGRKSFIETAVRDIDHNRLKFDIVKHVIDTKLAENAAAKDRTAKAARKDFLRGLLEKKQLNELEGLTVEEIQAQIAALDESASSPTV